MTCVRILNRNDGTTGLLCSEIETRPTPDCPNAAQHTPHPSSYNAYSNWADEMSKTHEQRLCDGCGLWNIWMPKGGEVA